MLDAGRETAFPSPGCRRCIQRCARRVLFGFLQTFGVRQPRREHVRQLEALLASQSASGRLSLPGVCLARNYDTIAPAAESAPVPAFAAVLQIPGVTPLPSLGLRIRCELAPAAENFEKIANSTTQIILNYAMIKGARWKSGRASRETYCACPAAAAR